jgi:archaeal type IV pilus assembly protein PilA
MKLKWKDEAVSPVIATILMVAITVVLAAVLYVMVIGMGGGGGTITQAPVGNWQDMSPTTSTSAKMVFGSFSPSPQLLDLRIIVQDANGAVFNLSWSGSTLASGNVSMVCDNPNVKAFYHDYNPSAGVIGSGDFIELYGLDSFTYYYTSIFHYPSDSIIQMAGDTTFQTLP